MIARAYIFPVCAPGASEGLVFVSAVTQVGSVAPHAPAVGPGVEPPLPGCHSHPVTLTALPSLRRAVNFTLEPVCTWLAATTHTTCVATGARVTAVGPR